MWVQLRRKVSREEFDDATILLLKGLILGTSGLVFALDYRDFFPYEFFRGDSGEIPVIGWVLANRVDVALNCFGVFDITECLVDCFFPKRK